MEVVLTLPAAEHGPGTVDVERDVFTPENGYDPELLREPNGLVHLDVLWFDVDLVDG